MLQITIPARECFDEESQTFLYTKERTLSLEHSLVSLSKWESKWNKAFLSDKKKTREETIDYIKCMTLDKNVDPNVYSFLTPDNLEAINKYIEAPMTATTFYNEKNERRSRDTITSELIYYWMIASNIPFECQKWHLNRLLTLIKVCQLKTTPPKKMSSGEILRRNAELNAARRRKLHSKG